MVISPFFQSFTVQILVLPLTKLQLSETHPPTGAGLTCAVGDAARAPQQRWKPLASGSNCVIVSGHVRHLLR